MKLVYYTINDPKYKNKKNKFPEARVSVPADHGPAEKKCQDKISGKVICDILIRK